MDFHKRIQKVAKHSVFSLRSEGFLVWCGSITKGDDGLFYLYFSFWPANKGHDAWVTHSKIGYAVADNPLGPYAYGGILLAGAGGDAWDRDCVHNPSVIKIGHTYYLYYMGTKGDGSYWSDRNNQRVGVAYANNPKGPFQRLDHPIIDVSPNRHDSLMTSNPTACVGGDGKIYLMYKAVCDNGNPPKGGAVVCGMAVADTPLGEYKKSDKPILTNPENEWSVEDPFIWYEDGRFYALAKDFQGYFTKAGSGTVGLFTSDNGLDWKIAEHPLAFRLELQWEDGTTEELKNMERPQMWLDETGKPRVLSCACVRKTDTDKQDSFNVQIGIE